jgi:hypothetical protein
METCAVCRINILEIIIYCEECPEKFCPECYKKCPTTAIHEPIHRYSVQKQNKQFLRPDMTYKDELNLLKQVEHSGSLKRNYSDFYIDGVIGDLTVSRKKAKIIDHTENLQNSQECKTEITVEDQQALGLLTFF